jgi:hypothetical protein
MPPPHTHTHHTTPHHTTPHPGLSAGSSKNKEEWTIAPSVQLSAQQLLTAVFDACLKALANMGVLLQDMVDTATAATTSSRSKGGGGGGGSRGGGGPFSSSSSRGGGVGPSSGSSNPKSTSGGGGGTQHSAAALQTLKQQQQHARSDSSGGGPEGSTAAAAAAAAIAATPGGVLASTAAAGAALDPLVALQSMQSGLLPASSVRFANGIATSLGATAASGSSMFYGPGGLATGTIQGLEYAKVTGKTPIGLLKTQCAHLWQEVQAECLLLLGELLRATLKGGSGGAQAAAQARWVLCPLLHLVCSVLLPECWLLFLFAAPSLPPALGSISGWCHATVTLTPVTCFISCVTKRHQRLMPCTHLLCCAMLCYAVLGCCPQPSGKAAGLQTLHIH